MRGSSAPCATLPKASKHAAVAAPVDVVCPQCTTLFSAEPGRIARCPGCGYTGGQVPGMADVQTYQPEERFLPDEIDPSDEDDEEEDEGEREQPKETSRVALTALIIGLSSTLIPLFAGPVAIGFGIGGIVQVSRNKETMSGKGLAITGMVFGALTTVVWFLLLVTLFAGAGRLVTGQ